MRWIIRDEYETGMKFLLRTALFAANEFFQQRSGPLLIVADLTNQIFDVRCVSCRQPLDKSLRMARLSPSLQLTGDEQTSDDDKYAA